jgi:hypothetical protein
MSHIAPDQAVVCLGSAFTWIPVLSPMVVTAPTAASAKVWNVTCKLAVTIELLQINKHVYVREKDQQDAHFS